MKSNTPRGERGSVNLGVLMLVIAVVIGVTSAAAWWWSSSSQEHEKAAAKDKVTSVKEKAGKKSKDEGDKSKSETTTTAPPDDSSSKGTSDDPYVGKEDNPNPVLSEVRSYRSLVKALVAQPGRGVWYTDDLQQFNGITRDDILRAAKLEKQGHDLRFILISNSNLTDSQARAQLKEQGVKEVDRLPIVRVNGFINTQGLPNDRMDPWDDPRSQVRVSLGIPVDWNDLSKGLQADRGILTMCGNGWKLKVVHKAPPATPVPETSVPTTAPPTTAPPTTAPPTTAPPTTAPPTTAPPTTAPPRTTTTVTVPKVQPNPCTLYPHKPGCPGA